MRNISELQFPLIPEPPEAAPVVISQMLCVLGVCDAGCNDGCDVA